MSKPTQAFWQQHLERQALSGLSLSRYAKDHDLSYASLFYWRKRLGMAPKHNQSAVSSFVKVVPAEGSTIQKAPMQEATTQEALTLCLPNGVKITGFQHTESLLAVLRQL